MGGLQPNQYRGGYDATEAKATVDKSKFYKTITLKGWMGGSRPGRNPSATRTIQSFDKTGYEKALKDATKQGYDAYFQGLSKDQLQKEMDAIQRDGNKGRGYFKSFGAPRRPGSRAPRKESAAAAMERYAGRYKELNQADINKANKRAAEARGKTDAISLIGAYEQQERKRFQAAKRGAGQTVKDKISRKQYDEAKSLLGNKATEKSKTTFSQKAKEKGRESLLFKEKK